MLARIQTVGTSLITKTTALVTKTVEKTVYCGKVTGELSKQIYKSEKLQPPSLDEFKSVYMNLYSNSLRYIKTPQQAVNCLKASGKNDLLKYGAIGIQLLGFYSVGEVIGRRKLVGYNSYAEKAIHH
ncbi:similar to Saccharomyces cerevisiae YPR020W ATP20 Subunit g of the mitochondrial F1F0 ATP synthase [Maudiozyma saulgeensis]|uniref:Similar to Saccharomyces cerevisiae YPR020W ATP20 Subunit g of the mitochondrial F1F0 ATP synthase n=1 Tax=Maudiozyma saulgeensis TaxID=1789683 RepID=A0A1X7QYS0_9SACH|nr:similar to Saccharomyces cerevisiae YPR020W ATP20 Subunit g of the mitochondrial F1F0 ATP synthase [Kazachstania saulgeensis]